MVVGNGKRLSLLKEFQASIKKRSTGIKNFFRTLNPFMVLLATWLSVFRTMFAWI